MPPGTEDRILKTQPAWSYINDVIIGDHSYINFLLAGLIFHDTILVLLTKRNILPSFVYLQDKCWQVF